MSLAYRDGEISYTSSRKGARFEARYGPASEVFRAAEGTLDHWLTERYCLYAVDPSCRLLRNDVHHAPWPLQRGKAEIRANTMLDLHGLTPLGNEPLLHFASAVDVVVWPAVRADKG